MTSTIPITYHRAEVGTALVDPHLQPRLSEVRWFLTKPAGLPKSSFLLSLQTPTERENILKHCSVRTLLGPSKLPLKLPRAVLLLNSNTKLSLASGNPKDLLKTAASFGRITNISGNPFNCQLDNLDWTSLADLNISPTELGQTPSDTDEIERLRREGLL